MADLLGQLLAHSLEVWNWSGALEFYEEEIFVRPPSGEVFPFSNSRLEESWRSSLREQYEVKY